MTPDSDPTQKSGGPILNDRDEGGLRAPPGLHGWRKAWWWFDFIILVKLARLRFIAILLVIGLMITQWDTLTAYYDKWTRPATASGAPSSDTEYFCPMHPSVVRDNAKDKCPICFMPLSKRKKGSGTVEALPAGVVNRVQLSPYRVVLAGVQTSPVEYQQLTKEITAAGYIEFNERGQRTVSARVAGRIDKLLANETGMMVNAGDELALLYSPDLLSTVQNLLDAKRANNRDYLAGAKTRLQLLGIDDAQIEEILTAEKPHTTLKIRSPISGHVIKKYVREGQYLQEGTPLYDIADLSTVWIQAQVYEDDLSFLPVDFAHGTPTEDAKPLEVEATTRAFPGETFRGALAFVLPHVDQDTRTVTVRFELKNPGHKLRPGSTATVTLRASPKEMPVFANARSDPKQSEQLASGDVLAVPESSIIDTGSQQIVYRQASPGVFEGVEVSLGPRMSGADGSVYFPVLSGLAAGEQVVTAGSFLVDAETRLNPAAGSIYFGGSGGGKDNSGGVTTVRPSTPENADDTVESALAKLNAEDRALVQAQRYCPILRNNRLGSMGAPVKLSIKGQPVFLCCSACKEKALAKPDETLATVEGLKKTKAAPVAASKDEPMAPQSKEELEIAEALAELPAADQALAKTQRFCPVLKDSRLGSMGKPVKLMIEGQPVFLCCEGCEDGAKENPQATLTTVKKLKEANGAATSPDKSDESDSNK